MADKSDEAISLTSDCFFFFFQSNKSALRQFRVNRKFIFDLCKSSDQKKVNVFFFSLGNRRKKSHRL